MTDNVTTGTVPSTIPAGTVIATDKIGGVDYQRVKVTWGVDGIANDVSALNPLPITDAVAVQLLTSLLAVFPVTADTNSGNKSASTLRVVLATDQPALANKLLVTPDANSAVNIAQMNGVTTTMGNGIAGTGVQRVTIASDSTGQVALAAGTATVGKTFTAYQSTKSLTNASVSASSSGENTLVSGTAAQTIRIFKIVIVAASAVSVSFKDAAGGAILTGAMPMTANGSMVLESEGEPLFVSASAGAFILNLSAAVAVTGYIQYVKS